MISTISGQVGSDKQPSPKGRLVPPPSHDGYDRKTGKPLPLTEMRTENVLLTLPQGMFQVTISPTYNFNVYINTDNVKEVKDKENTHKTKRYYLSNNK